MFLAAKRKQQSESTPKKDFTVYAGDGYLSFDGQIGLEELVQHRDYSGSVAYCEFMLASKKASSQDLMPKLALCHYQNGNIEKAKEIYQELLKSAENDNDGSNLAINLACCQISLGEYEEADRTVKSLAHSKVQNRLLLQISHKLHDEARVLNYHRYLEDIPEDQLALASIHYSRGHFQEAIDVYKKLVEEHPEYVAVNVFIAMCYFRLEFFDLALEFLALYTKADAESFTAAMIHACILSKLNDGRVAEAHLDRFMEKVSTHFMFYDSLVKHNKVIFQNGERALQVLPALLDIVPEARLNLAIYHLENDNADLALELCRDFEPVSFNDNVVKAVVYATVGQKTGDEQLIQEAKSLFHAVGSDSAECDTIPGRLCLASNLILDKQIDEALVYLGSVKAYLMNDDCFNFNIGQLKVSKGEWIEAEEYLTRVKGTKMLKNPDFVKVLCLCYIHNKRPQLAWNLFLDMDTSAESFMLLQLLAGACFKAREFYHSAKAYDYLEKLVQKEQFRRGKLAACVGAFQQIYNGEQSHPQILGEIVAMLQNTNVRSQEVVRCEEAIRRWSKQNGISLV